jgi:hypothetical protein
LILANVKNIQIGIAPKQYILNSNNALVGEMSAKVGTKTSYDTEIIKLEFRCYSHSTNGFLIITDVYCCTSHLFWFDWCLGQKTFPTMLIAPGSFYIQVRFAKVAQAFKFTMDPCRRIFGTYRDYVPSVCLVSSAYITEFGGNVLSDGRRRYISNHSSGGTNTWLAITEHVTEGCSCHFHFNNWCY